MPDEAENTTEVAKSETAVTAKTVFSNALSVAAETGKKAGRQAAGVAVNRILTKAVTEAAEKMGLPATALKNDTVQAVVQFALASAGQIAANQLVTDELKDHAIFGKLETLFAAGADVATQEMMTKLTDQVIDFGGSQLGALMGAAAELPEADAAEA